MSGGGIIGAVVGAVAGFFVGGPMGAVYGASLGFAVGSYIDPMTPDSPSVGAPNPEEVVMKSTVGDPCPDLCGSAKIPGHLLLYGKERSVPVYAESQSAGGKGGAPTQPEQISGYDYYMSWALGICAGPVTVLYAIYRNNDELLWEGPLYLPASGGQETIVIDDFGTIEFYFGTGDQVANSKIGEIIGDATLNSPLRYFCWAFCDDCKIGNYPRTPTLNFVLKKLPDVDYSVINQIQEYDATPLSIEWHILKNLCGLPVEWLDEDDFYSADIALRDESRGMSCLLDKEMPAIDWIKNINNHIDCMLKYGNDGKLHPKLIRDDYDVDTIPTIDEDDILDDPSIIRPSWIDTTNEMKAQYSEIIDVDRSGYKPAKIMYATGRNSFKRLSLNHADGAILYPFLNNLGELKNYAYTDYGIGNGCLAYRQDGSYWVWGENDEYQLGLGYSSPAEYDPIEITYFKGLRSKYIRNNEWCSCIIFDDNIARYCGYDVVQPSVGTDHQESWGEVGPNGDSILWEDMNLHIGRGVGLGVDGFIYYIGYVFTSLGKKTSWTKYSDPSTPGGPHSGNGSKMWYDSGVSSILVLIGTELWHNCPNADKAGLGGTGTSNTGFGKISGNWKYANNTGSYKCFAIDLSGALYSWGLNSYGALGLGDPNTSAVYTTPTLVNEGPFVDVWAHSEYVVALHEDGSIWGAGRQGQAYGVWGLGVIGASGSWNSTTLVKIEHGGPAFQLIKCFDSQTVAFV